jgi:hypothetical protein
VNPGCKLILGLAAALALAGCTPDCERTCRKVLSCDIDSPRDAIDMCKASCETEDHLYDVWDDQEKTDAFHEERRCLVDSSCEDIAAGACYDDRLYPF